jgi:hypothetical protein
MYFSDANNEQDSEFFFDQLVPALSVGCLVVLCCVFPRLYIFNHPTLMNKISLVFSALQIMITTLLEEVEFD